MNRNEREEESCTEEESVIISADGKDFVTVKESTVAGNGNNSSSESDKATYCLACGSSTSIISTNDNGEGDTDVVIKTEKLTDDNGRNDNDENGRNISGDDYSNVKEHQPKKEEEELNVTEKTSTEQVVFQNFCGLLGIKLTGIKLGGGDDDIQANDAETVVPVFCQICRNQLALLVDLREKLKELERDLENGLTEFKRMCQNSEEKFQGSQVYKQGNIYLKIRKQICGKDKEQTKRGSTKNKKDNQSLLVDNQLKCTKGSTTTIRTRSQSPLKSNVQHENVCIKVEPEVSAFKGENEVDNNFDRDDLINSPFEKYQTSEDDEDEYTPPRKVRKSSPPKKRKKLGRPPKSKKKKVSISAVNKKKKLKSSSAKAVDRQSLKRRSPAKRDKEYALSDDGDDNDSEEDIEASLRGRMSTDPTTGHVIFLNVSFEALSSGRYRCLTCEKDSAYHRGSLKKHVITMHTSMFVCQECDQHCPSSKSLNSHVRRVHRGEDRKTVDCKICGKPCSSKRGRMEKHMTTHLSAQEKEEAKARGEEIPQWSKLRRHVCDQCGRGYELKSHLIQHKIREHPSTDYTDEDKVACKEMCPDCGKLVHRHYLKKHQEFVHSEGLTKRFSCMLCQRRFAKESDLRKHKNVVHEKIKPFNCSLCPKQFALKTQLNYHLQTHQNIRPFVCDHCPMAFARKHHLERHLKIYHEPGANPKRKTYVKGPETKTKCEAEEQVARGSIIQVCGMLGRPQEESSQISTEGGKIVPVTLEINQLSHHSQQHQVTWLGHQAT